MSRSGYTDDWDDQWGLIRWRGAVASAIRGKRGQAFLREMVDAMDAMEVKELHAEVLAEDNGCVCAMGAVVKARGLDAAEIDPEDDEAVSRFLGLSNALVREIAYNNDEGAWDKETPAARWVRMRNWATSKIKNTAIPTEL